MLRFSKLECNHKATKLLKVSETRAAVFLTDGAILKSYFFLLLSLLIFILKNLI